MKHDKDKITTSQLLAFIRKSGQFSEVTDYMSEMNISASFSDYLYEVMDSHGFTPKEVVQESGIERSYFYHLLSGQRRNPSRNVVLRLALCVHASLKETQQLLRLSSTGSLYPKVERDAALIYAIENRYTMQEANQLLLGLNVAPLYQEESR